MAAKDVRDVNFAVIDTETTGIHVHSNRVCELAGILTKGYEEVSSFSWLINPEMPMPYGAQKIHGISDLMLADKPRFSSLAGLFLSNIENTVLVGHNIMFDVRFLGMELNRIGLKFPRLPVVDTLVLAKKSGLFASNSLGDVAKALNIDCRGWHRAMNDVKTTKEVLYFFIRRMEKEKQVCTLEDIHAICGSKYSDKF